MKAIKLTDLIDQYILPSESDPDETLAIAAGKYCTLPYSDVNSKSWPEAAAEREFTRLREAMLDGKLIDDVYFCTATLEEKWAAPPTSNKRYQGLLRRQAQVKRWIAFCADDVGTKIPLSRLQEAEPTFVIETSPDNYQYIYVFIVPVEDMGIARNFLKQAKELGLTDAGGLQITKLVRLPTGVNTKRKYFKGGNPWQVKLSALPGKKWDIIELSKALGMDTRALSSSEPAMVGLKASNVVSINDTSSLTVVAALEKQEARIMEQNKWGTDILQSLVEAGMVKIDAADIEGCASTTSGYIPIVCPWADGHSDGGVEDGNGDTGFSPVGFGTGADEKGNAYRLGNQFHCFHEHCYGRGMAVFMDWCREQGWIASEPSGDGKTVGFHDKLAELMRYLCVCTEDGKLYDFRYPRSSGMSIGTARQVVYAPWRREKIPIFNYWAADYRHHIINGRVYHPGANVKITDTKGCTMLNTWYKPQRKPAQVSKEVRAILDRHFKNGVDDDEQLKLLKAFVASCIVHPEIRLKFALIWQSTLQGIGKGMVSQLVRALIGEDNHNSITVHEFVTSNYNAWLSNCTFLDIPEFIVEAGGVTGNIKMLNRINQLITENTQEVNTKYGVTNQQKIWANIFACTNHPDAIGVRSNDRRFAIVACDNAALDADHYLTLGGLLESEAGLCEALGYMHEVDDELGAWIRSQTRAPMTEAKHDMIELTTTPIEAAVEALLGQGRDELVWPSCLIAIGVREYCRGAPGGNAVETMSNRNILAKAALALKERGLRPGPRSNMKRFYKVKKQTWSRPYTESDRLSGEQALAQISAALDSSWHDVLSAIVAWTRTETAPKE